MIFEVILAVFLALCTATCFAMAIGHRSHRLTRFIVGLCFLVFAFYFLYRIGYSIGSGAPNEYAPFGPEKATVDLAYYISDDAKDSTNYYVEITDKGTYKFCYFSDDAVTINKIEAPTDKCEIVADNEDLPYRVEIYRKNKEIYLYRLHIPDDANAIQYDADGK